jgi:uncharacterized protein YndB with AHSA1/START domain
MPERIEVSRLIRAEPTEIFAVLRDPKGHVAIDASGSLMSSEDDLVSAVGDTFVVHMDREAIGDVPLGLYDVTVEIVTYEPNEAIAWTVGGQLDPPVAHVYGYRLASVAGGTEVTHYCDWSNTPEFYKSRATFPVIPESALRATLGILARTVQNG